MATCRRRRIGSGWAIASCSSGSAATSRPTLSAFDLSVFPSLWEGTPLTGFEALAMGKPIVATDADGLLDVLTDGGDAAIVPKRNAGRARRQNRLGDRSSRRAGPARRRGAADGAPVRHRRFVRKMERLYTLLHEVSRPTHRRGVLRADLSFLDSGEPA